MKVSVKYNAGHTIESEWLNTNIYCPNCGKKEVWRENDGGDYYLGESYLCISCEHGFNEPNISYCIDELDKQRLEQLKEKQ